MCAGWTKPTAASTLEAKAEWIFAKYRWHAFVSDDLPTDSTIITKDVPLSGLRDILVQGILHACATPVHTGDTGNDSVQQSTDVLRAVQAWLASRSNVNSVSLPPHGDRRFNGMTPLHLAVLRGNTDLVAFLAMNGADMFLPDAQGVSALELSEQHYTPGSRSIIKIFADIQRAI